MAQKTTISIPNGLYKRMQEWKGVINFSEEFRIHIDKVIRRKEELKKRLKGDIEMLEIIGRLKKEKREIGPDLFEGGYKEGIEWAKMAHFWEIKEVLEWEPGERGKRYPMQDSVDESFQNYVDSMLDNYSLDKQDWFYGRDNEDTQKFWDGWKKGLEDFWDEIKDEI